MAGGFSAPHAIDCELAMNELEARVPVKHIYIQECPQTPSAWGLWLEPRVGEAVCVIRCDANKINDVVCAVRTSRERT